MQPLPFPGPNRRGRESLRDHLLLALVLAFAFWSATPQGISAQGRLIVDPDSVVSFQVPDGWTEADLENRDASVIMSDAEEQAFFLVIIERKDDLYGWNLTRAEYVTVGQTVGALDNPEVEGPQRILIDDLPAVQYVIRGATGGVQLTYLKVTVDAPTAFVQLIGWTGRSTWSTQRGVLEDIVGSAKVLKRPGG